MPLEEIPPTESHGEDVAWLEQRLDRLESQSQSLTPLLNAILAKLEQQPSLTINPEQLLTLQSFLETATGTQATKLQAILDKLEANPGTSILPAHNPANAENADPTNPNNPAPAPAPPAPAPAPRRSLRPI